MTGTLKVLAVGDPAVEVYADLRCGIIEKYELEKGVKISFEIVPWANYYTTMMGAFEGKQMYDIVMVAGHLWSADFVKKGYISPVYYPEDDSYDMKDILPVVREEMEVDGKTYLFPSFCDGHILLYRKSFLDKATGSRLGKIITTDELISAVKGVHGFQGISGIALKAHPSEIFLDALPYLRNEGIDVFSPETHEPVFNNINGINGLKKYLSLRAFAPEDTGSYGNEGVCLAFQKRKAAFCVTWGGQLGTVMNNMCEEPSDVGFASLSTPWNVTWSFAVNSRSQKQEEANCFLSYLTSKEIDRAVGRHAGSPVRRTTYETDCEKYPWYSIHLEMISEYAKPLPKMIQAGLKLNKLYEQITLAFRNVKTADDALSDADAAIRKLNEGKG